MKPKTKSTGRTLIVVKDAAGKVIRSTTVTNPRAERVRYPFEKRGTWR